MAEHIECVYTYTVEAAYNLTASIVRPKRWRIYGRHVALARTTRGSGVTLAAQLE